MAKFKSSFGKDIETGLKYSYDDAITKSEVKKYKMTKEELEEYLKELEKKNRWKRIKGI